MGETSMGATAMGLLESPIIRADMGPDSPPETWTLKAPSFPVPFTLATMGCFSWSSDPWTVALASASTLKVTIVSPHAL